MLEIPEFVDREKEIKELKAVLSGRPNFVYFVYGPINSGKTVLLMKVFEELPENYVVFYINFRGLETRRYEDFVRAMFTVKYQGVWEKIKEKGDLLLGGVKFLERVAKKLNYTIPVPKDILRALIGGKDEEMDCFKYLEEVMRRLVEKRKRPVFVLDELQMLKEINKNGPILHDLFNFLVRMTKETHLCHCLCATSDCLFMDLVYNSARLEGRAKYFLVDDLEKETAFRVYEEFGFENKKLVWEYIGGKIGDIVSLFEEKKRGYSEGEALERMLLSEVDKLDELLRRIKKVKKKIIFEGEEIEIEESGLRESLSVFKFEEKVRKDIIDIVYRNFLIEQNILFYNPLTGTVRPQSRLLWRAIRQCVNA
jgi:AAA+ ATPase superfamily predicted ATPase